MATSAQIQSAVADALENDLTFTEMAALLKRAIINAIIASDGTIALPWNNVGSDSTSISRMTLDQAQAVLDFCLTRANGGLVSSLAEFRNPV